MTRVVRASFDRLEGRAVRSSLERLWTLLFVALVQLPIAAVVGGLVGAQNAGPFWFMGIAAHLQVRSATDLSFGRRLAIWLAAVTAGGITGGLIAIAIILLTLAVPTLSISLFAQAMLALVTADSALSIPSWTGVFVLAVVVAISVAPVLVAWGVSGILVRRAIRRGEAASLRAVTRQSTPGRVELQKASEIQAAETPARSLRARATLPTGAKQGWDLNWKNGLLRLWLVINLPLIAYFGYSIYANHQCQRWAQDQVRQWSKSMWEHQAARDRRMFDWAREMYKGSAASMDACRDGREFAVGVLEIVPAGSAALMLAGLWVTRGFRRGPSTPHRAGRASA